MKDSLNLKNWEISLLLALCITMMLGTWAQAKQAELSSNLVRLHVLAVSDDIEEQSIKLKVRDAVIACLSPKLDSIDSAAQAQEIIGSSINDIQKAAESVSCGRRVTVTLSEEYYPTRHYNGFSLPAGKYQSLKVVLGDGLGHNWWCVVFPPLCLDSSMQSVQALALDEDDYGIVTCRDGYMIKFRILELWGQLIGASK